MGRVVSLKTRGASSSRSELFGHFLTSASLLRDEMSSWVFFLSNHYLFATKEGKGELLITAKALRRA